MRTTTQPVPVRSNTAPAVSRPTRELVADALRNTRPAAPDPPSWAHRVLPAAVRRAMAGLGWWTNPVPQPPSAHLKQTLAVIEKYGWCQSLDTSPTGRLCIRGAQNLLEKTGHTTPAAREKAVAYMQQALAHAGITMQFFTWNDLPDQHLSAVQALIRRAADLARANGE